MNKSILVQYTDMQQEIKDLKERIEKIDRQANTIITDSVRGSSADYPYTEHNCIVEGKDYRTNVRLDKYKAILKDNYNKLLELQTSVEEYISSIQDSKIRQIVRFRYIDNHSWNKIGQLMNVTADSIRMEHNRFFDKI